jgi:hypothetical protein
VSPGTILSRLDRRLQTFPVAHRGTQSLGYVFQDEIRHPLSPERLYALGIPAGRERAALARGEVVVLSDGRRVTPEIVVCRFCLLLLWAVKDHPHRETFRRIFEPMRHTRGTEEDVTRAYCSHGVLYPVTSGAGGHEVELVPRMRNLRPVGGSSGEPYFQIAVYKYFGRSPGCPREGKRGGKRYWRRGMIHMRCLRAELFPGVTTACSVGEKGNLGGGGFSAENLIPMRKPPEAFDDLEIRTPVPAQRAAAVGVAGQGIE